MYKTSGVEADLQMMRYSLIYISMLEYIEEILIIQND